MASTTPLTAPPARPNHTQKPPANLPSRPTTPLRPPSRSTSLRASQNTPSGTSSASGANPAFALTALEPAFAELSDSMADLEANFMHLQLLNESLGRFNENFAGFLYGLNMSAFCVDFPEAPIPPSFTRNTATTHTHTNNQYETSPFRSSVRHHQANSSAESGGMRDRDRGDGNVDATFLTTDTSFVEYPPTSSKPASKYSSVPPSALSGGRQSSVPTRRGSTTTTGRGRGGTTNTPAARGGMRGRTTGTRGATRGGVRGASTRGAVR